MAGGKKMDTFMDKLAQKLNAQEMIKANNSAEAAQNAHLKSKVKEYEEVLTKLQSKLQNMLDTAPNGSGDKGDMPKEDIQKLKEDIEALLNDKFEQNRSFLTESREALIMNRDAIIENNDSIQACKSSIADLNRKVDDLGKASMSNNFQEMKELIETKVSGLEDGMKDQSEATLEELHKECVKVYRNVQAVVEEQTEKQNEELELKLKKQSKKITGLTVVAVLSMILSLASVAGIAFELMIYFQVI